MYQLLHSYELSVATPMVDANGAPVILRAVMGWPENGVQRDPDFVGLLDTGSQRSAAVRTNDTERTANHGTIGGPNYLGSQSYHLELFIIEPRSGKRADSLDRLNAVLFYGLNGGMTLKWDESNGRGPGGNPKMVTGLKTAQMPVITHSADPTKKVVFQMDAGFPFVTSQLLDQQTRQPGQQLLLDNAGAAPMAPTFYVFGACSAFTLTQAVTGESITVNQTLSDTDFVTVDMRSGTVLLNGTTDIYGAVSETANQFFTIPGPGFTPVTFDASGTDGHCSVRCDYRSTWVE